MMRGIGSRILAPWVVLLSLWGCEEKQPIKKVDDELTIVVEADKTRIAAEEAALNEQRKTLEAERERLRQEVEKLDAVKEDREAKDPQARDLLSQTLKLLKQQDEVTRRRDALAQETDALLKKVVGEGRPVAAAMPAPPSPLATAPTVELARVTSQIAGREREMAGRERTLGEREANLAERERGLAQREAALAARDSACVSAGAAVARERRSLAGPGLEKATVEKAYKRLLATMDSKGILASDLPSARQKAFKDAAGFQKGDLAQALEAVEQVETAVQALAIDGPFVSEKAKRVDALQRRSKNAKAREEVARQLQEMTRAYSDGRYQEANRALNEIVHLLEKP